MTPSTVMGALIELEGAENRAATLARLLGIEDEGAIELLRRALQAERDEAWARARAEEEW